MTQSRVPTPVGPRPPRIHGHARRGCVGSIADPGESDRLVTEGELNEIWSHVCAALEHAGPCSTLPRPDAEEVAGDFAGLPPGKSYLPSSSPYSLESTKCASARSTGTKSSPWSLVSAMAKQASEFPEAASRQADFQPTPDPIGSVAGDPRLSMVDAAQLRLKLERLAGHSMRHPLRDAYYTHTSSRQTSKSRLGDMSSRSKGTGTPLSVHSLSVPPWADTPQQPSPSQLPWLQLSGSQFSMPSFRALQACAGDACERPVGSQGTDTPKSASGPALPPLPGAVADTIIAAHTLRNLARSSQIRNRCDLDSSLRSMQPCDRRDHCNLDTSSGRSFVQRLNLAREAGGTISQVWRAPREREVDLSRNSLSPSLPRKRSRFKRMLFRLWRFGRSRSI